MFNRLENIKDTNLTKSQAIKDQGEKQLRELKNIDKSRTLKQLMRLEEEIKRQIKCYMMLRI